MILIQKIYNEGTSSAFFARLKLGLFEIRDAVYSDESNRLIFDEDYGPIFDAMHTCRESVKKVIELVNNHKTRIAKGEIIKHQNNSTSITESLDIELEEQVKNIFIHGAIAVKNVQIITRMLNTELGFLYQKDSLFNEGVKKLVKNGENELAGYLCEVRKKWSKDFFNTRTQIEHKGWALPKVEYLFNQNRSAEIVAPNIDGIPITEYVITIINRIISYVENVLVYSLNKNMRINIVTEIPEEKRDPGNKKRFELRVKAELFSKQLGNVQNGYPKWTIYYNEDNFI